MTDPAPDVRHRPERRRLRIGGVHAFLDVDIERRRGRAVRVARTGPIGL